MKVSNVGKDITYEASSVKLSFLFSNMKFVKGT